MSVSERLLSAAPERSPETRYSFDKEMHPTRRFRCIHRVLVGDKPNRSGYFLQIVTSNGDRFLRRIGRLKVTWHFRLQHP